MYICICMSTLFSKIINEIVSIHLSVCFLAMRYQWGLQMVRVGSMKILSFNNVYWEVAKHFWKLVEVPTNCYTLVRATTKHQTYSSPCVGARWSVSVCKGLGKLLLLILHPIYLYWFVVCMYQLKFSIVACWKRENPDKI